MSSPKNGRTISLPYLSHRKHKELHLIDQKFIIEVREVAEDCISYPGCLSLTYLEDIEKTILTLLIISSIQ